MLLLCAPGCDHRHTHSAPLTGEATTVSQQVCVAAWLWLWVPASAARHAAA